MTNNRDRGERGEYVETFSPNSVLEVFEGFERPFVTSKEVATALDCSHRTARRKLGKLDDVNGDSTLRRVNVGERAAVWWLPDSSTDSDSSTE
jgi:Fic family protein